MQYTLWRKIYEKPLIQLGFNAHIYSKTATYNRQNSISYILIHILSDKSLVFLLYPNGIVRYTLCHRVYF